NSDSFPQPGCEEKNQTLGRVIPYALRNLIGSCDHHRAVDFYSASITNQNFIGCKFQSTDTDKDNHHHDHNDGTDQQQRDKPRRFHKCSKECDPFAVFGEHVNHSVRGEYCLILKLE
ncbi:Endothelial lipase, partial [Orchesella cincta]